MLDDNIKKFIYEEKIKFLLKNFGNLSFIN